MNDYVLTLGNKELVGKTLEFIWCQEELSIEMSGKDYLIWLYTHYMIFIDPKPEAYAIVGHFLEMNGVKLQIN